MKTDYDIIRAVFNFGKVLGMSTPWKESESPQLVLMRKMYLIFLIVLTVLAVIFSGYNKYYGFWKVLPNTTQMILEVLQFFAELCFFISCFWCSMMNAKCWKIIFSYTKRIDFVLSKYKFSANVCAPKYYFLLLLVNTSYVTLHAYELCSWQGKEDMSMEDGYILDRVLMYYQIYLTTIIFMMNIMIRRRYSILKNLLINMLDRRKKNVIIDQEANTQFLAKLFLIKETYANLHLVMTNMNLIFGWPTFFSIVSSVFLCLVNVNYIFLFTGSNSAFNASLFASAALYTGVYTVSASLVVYKLSLTFIIS